MATQNLLRLLLLVMLVMRIVIFGYACHSLTDSCLVNLIDVTLACEDAYSKLVEAVTVAEC